MAATTTIRLPPALRVRLHALARQHGQSAHSIIVEAVERHVAYEERMRALVQEALAVDGGIERAAEVFRADDVHAWVKMLAGGEPPGRPKPWQR
jgi:predicted transcriptional regulator